MRLAAACANSLVHLSLPCGTTDRGYIATLGGAMRDARGGGYPLVESITVGHEKWGASATAGALAGLGVSFPELKSASIRNLTGLEEPDLATQQRWSPAPRLAELRISQLGAPHGPVTPGSQLHALVAGVCSSFSNLEVLDLNSGLTPSGRALPQLCPGLGGVATSLTRLRSLTLRSIGIAAADGGGGGVVGGAGGGGASSSAAAAAAPSAVGLLPPSLTSLVLVNCGGFAAGACIEPFIEPTLSLAAPLICF